jgi:WD40 repeat protein
VRKNTKMQGKESSTSKERGKDNLPYLQEVTSAQFFYLDKFILLSCGKQFFLYKYHIDMEKPDDVKRYQSSTRSVLVTALQSTSAQSITALSAVNDFYSYIVLVCGSDKSIEIFDMNVGKSAAVLSNATERPVHCIAQNKGSKFISHPPEGYDLFLTSAVTDGVKLWDLRQSKCVQHFVTHPNRVQPVGVTFSPCAKYIATGAENRSAYIYDIRSQSPLHRLACHSDAVTSVSYHPLQNQMIAGTSDGKLCQFTTDA